MKIPLVKRLGLKDTMAVLISEHGLVEVLRATADAEEQRQEDAESDARGEAVFNDRD